MQALLGLLGAFAGLAAGAWLGYKVGKAPFTSGPLVYWTLNGVVFVVGLVVNIIGLTLGLFWLAMVGPGLIAGGISGLKFGYGRIEGPWKAVDTVTGGHGAAHAASDRSMADRSRDVAVPEPRTAAEAFGRPRPKGGRKQDPS